MSVVAVVVAVVQGPLVGAVVGDAVVEVTEAEIAAAA